MSEQTRTERCAVRYPNNPRVGPDHCWHLDTQGQEYCCHCGKRKEAAASPVPLERAK